MADEKQIVQDLIEELRKEIDEIDEAIIGLVQQRTEVSARIARLKRREKIPIVDGKRERVIFSRYSKALGSLGKTMAGALLRKNKDVPAPDSED